MLPALETSVGTRKSKFQCPNEKICLNTYNASYGLSLCDHGTRFSSDLWNWSDQLNVNNRWLYDWR